MTKEYWEHKRVLVSQNEERRLVVTAGLHKLGGNDRPYFSVTADTFYRGDREATCCGCQHDEVLEAFPELKPVVELHLADDRGWPMHAVDNAAYHASEAKVSDLARHLRVDREEAAVLIGRALAVVEEHVKEVSDTLNAVSAHEFVEDLKQRMHRTKRSDIGDFNRKWGRFFTASSYELGRLYEDHKKAQIKQARHDAFNHFFKDVVKNHFASIWAKQAEEAIALLDSLPEAEEPKTPLLGAVDELNIKFMILDEETDRAGHRKLKVQLTRKEGKKTKTLTTPFQAGSAAVVNAEAVLQCMFSDADCLEYCSDGEELQREFGYEDAREADRLYRQIVLQTERLQKFLGHHYDRLRQPEL